MSIASIQTGKHYVWGGNCDGWHQATRARVKVTIERELDQVLPQVIGRAEFAQTCSRLFEHVVQQY